MNKSIWHSALEIPLFDDTVVFIDDLNNWHTGYTQRDNDGITDHDSGEIYTEENVLRWAYIKDLLALETENKYLSDKIGKLETELERTRKALEIAVKAMESAKYFRLEHCMCCGHDPQKDAVYIKLKNALEQITALEQKDV